MLVMSLFGTCICSNVEIHFSFTCLVFQAFEFRTSLGTSIVLTIRQHRSMDNAARVQLSWKILRNKNLKSIWTVIFNCGRRPYFFLSNLIINTGSWLGVYHSWAARAYPSCKEREARIITWTILAHCGTRTRDPLLAKLLSLPLGHQIWLLSIH